MNMFHEVISPPSLIIIKIKNKNYADKYEITIPPKTTNKKQ